VDARLAARETSVHLGTESSAMVARMTTEQSAAAVRMFNAALDATEARDPDRMIEGWARDGVLEFPFAPEGFPARVEGRSALLEFFHQFPKFYSKIRVVDRIIEPLADGSGIVAQYRGEWTNVKGRPYNNTYVAVLRFRDGEVVHMREYFNPQVWLDSLK
jgi:hypothetical protein